MLGARRERRPVDQPRERPDEREQVVAVDAVAQGAIPGVSADRLPDPGVATVHRRISLRRWGGGPPPAAAPPPPPPPPAPPPAPTRPPPTTPPKKKKQ